MTTILSGPQDSKYSVGLELVRGDHAEATVEPAEVVPIDPRGGRELESVIVLYGPSWKTAPSSAGFAPAYLVQCSTLAE